MQPIRFSGFLAVGVFIASVAAAQTARAIPKLPNGHAVDGCLHWGAQCGKPAADEYCHLSGFSGGAQRFEWDYMKPTWIIGDMKTCDQAGCRGFTSIECAGAPTSQHKPGAWVFRDMQAYTWDPHPQWPPALVSANVDLRGGVVELNINGNMDGRCPGGTERVRITWAFDRDISELMPGSEFGWHGDIKRIAGNGKCNGQSAGSTYMAVVGSDGASIPPLRELRGWDQGRFYGKVIGRANGAPDDPNRNSASGIVGIRGQAPFQDLHTGVFFVGITAPGEIFYWVYYYDAPK